MKIVVNRCFGGFGLSEEAYKALKFDWDKYGYPDNKMFEIESENIYAYRAAPILIEVVERLGSKLASGRHAQLEIVEIPDGIEWEIKEYGGTEHIAEKHRTW